MGSLGKVLVIDDSPFIFKAVKRALEPCGYEIVGYAENGKIGLEMYSQFSPDVITLDVTMPVMDGIETAQNLLKLSPKPKIIMLSAMGDESLVQNAKKLGVAQFLAKPFKADELINVVKLLLNC